MRLLTLSLTLLMHARGAQGFIATPTMTVSYQHFSEKTAAAPSYDRPTVQETNGIPCVSSPRRLLVTSALVLGALFGVTAHGPAMAASLLAKGGVRREQNEAEQQPVDVALAFLKAYNQADWDRMRDLTHEDYVFISIPTGIINTGRDKGLQHYMDFKKASPEDHAVIRSATSTHQCFDSTNNNKCAGGAVVEVVFTGINIKPTPEDKSIPAKGNQYEIPAVILFDIQDGQVKETRKYYDMLTLKRQFGANS